MSTQDLKTPEIISSYFAHTVVDADPLTITFIKQDGSADAGEIAGTIVYSKIRGPVFNLIGDRLGEFTGDPISTSLVFTTSVMDSTKEIGFVYDARANNRLADTIAKLEDADNGSWAMDYFTGLLVIKKKTNGVSQDITTWKLQVADPTGNGSGASGVQIAAATSSDKGLVAVDTTVGGTEIVPANANRKYALIQNKDATTKLYVGKGVITSDDIEVLAPLGTFIWESKEALKGLSASGTIDVAFIDYNN